MNRFEDPNDEQGFDYSDIRTEEIVLEKLKRFCDFTDDTIKKLETRKNWTKDDIMSIGKSLDLEIAVWKFVGGRLTRDYITNINESLDMAGEKGELENDDDFAGRRRSHKNYAQCNILWCNRECPLKDENLNFYYPLAEVSTHPEIMPLIRVGTDTME
eukprot:UN28427